MKTLKASIALLVLALFSISQGAETKTVTEIEKPTELQSFLRTQLRESREMRLSSEFGGYGFYRLQDSDIRTFAVQNSNSIYVGTPTVEGRPSLDEMVEKIEAAKTRNEALITEE